MSRSIIFLVFLGIFSTPVFALRIVSISPVVTEIVYALGEGPSLVGATRWCTYPEAAKALPRIGDATLNFESIVSLHPDLVLGVGNKSSDLAKLKALHLNTEILTSPRSIEDIYSLILSIGKKLNRSDHARVLVSQLRKKSPTPSKTSKPKPRVLVVLWAKPIITAGKTSYINSMIEKAGGENIGALSTHEYPTLSAESIIASNPDVVIATHPDLIKELEKVPFWPLLKATKNHHIYVVESDLISRAGPRFVDGISAINKAIREAQ